MGKLIGKIIGLVIVRTFIILSFAPLLQYFANRAFTAQFLGLLFGTGDLNYWQAVYVCAVAAVLSLV